MVRVPAPLRAKSDEVSVPEMDVAVPTSIADNWETVPLMVKLANPLLPFRVLTVLVVPDIVTVEVPLVKTLPVPLVSQLPLTVQAPLVRVIVPPVLLIVISSAVVAVALFAVVPAAVPP